MADTYQFLVANFGDAYRRVPNVGVLGKGVGENNMYFLSVNPATGGLVVDAQVVLDQDTNYGPVGDDTLRTAAQIGNATGAADFNAGATGAQTLRVVLADEQADAIDNIETYASIIATETGEIAEDVVIMALDVADIKTAVEATQAAAESIDTKTPELGQAVKASSVPVTLASDQGALPVSATDLDIRNLSSANDSVAAVQSGDWNLKDITGTISLPTGAATEATLDDTLTEVSLLNLKVNVGVGDSAGAVRVVAANNSPGHKRETLHLVRVNYETDPVTTSAYVELISSTDDDIYRLDIFDSSGETLVLAVGPASPPSPGDEVDIYYISPGGNGIADIFIPKNMKLFIKAVSNDATVGELLITVLT